MRWLLPLSALFLFLLLLTRPGVLTALTREGLALCARQVVPALFPFLALGELLLRSGLPGLLPEWFCRPFCALFRISRAAVPAILLGALCGFPVGGKIAADMLRSGEIDKKEAERLVAFCNNTGPAFAVVCIGQNLLGNRILGVWLYVIQMTFSLLAGLLIGRRAERPVRSAGTGTRLAPAGWSCIPEAISAASRSMLIICGFVVFFCVLTGTLATLLPAPILRPFLSALLEVTAGASASRTLPSPALTAAFAAFSVGWSGLSVHLQLAAFLPSGFSLRRYFTVKLCCGLAEGVATYAAVCCFPAIAPDAAVTASAAFTPLCLPGAFLLLFCSLCIFGSFLIKKIEKRKNICYNTTITERERSGAHEEKRMHL